MGSDDVGNGDMGNGQVENGRVNPHPKFNIMIMFGCLSKLISVMV